MAKIGLADSPRECTCIPSLSRRRFDIRSPIRLDSSPEQEQPMKTLHTRSPTFLAGGLALTLIAASAFAAHPPADPDPTSKGTPMEDAHVPNTQSTTPYSSSSSSSKSSSTSSDMS